jgi:hypothetical protein
MVMEAPQVFLIVTERRRQEGQWLGAGNEPQGGTAKRSEANSGLSFTKTCGHVGPTRLSIRKLTTGPGRSTLESHPPFH